MTHAEYERLRKHLPLRSRVALDIMADTGLRVSDVIRLRKEQLHKRITVREAKNGFEHEVRLSDRTLAGAKRLARIHDGERIIPVHRKTVWSDIQKACQQCGIPPLSPHSCRKYYARQVYAKTKSIEETRKIMGHKSQACTMFYVFEVS